MIYINGEYTQGDSYWESFKTYKEAFDRMAFLIENNQDDELNIKTFKIEFQDYEA